jgi:site-specific recombinase XerD
MNTKNNTPNHHPICDTLAFHVDHFVSDLKNAGYPATTLSTKRAALRKFINWRRTRKNTDSQPDESAVKAFMAKACTLAAGHRSVASTALFGFLDHLRRQGVIPKQSAAVRATARNRLLQSYADFLRDEKGLAELSLRVYLPVAASLLEYLHGQYLRRDRGVRPTQRVFLRAKAPRVPLTCPTSIGHIVRRSLAQAGIERPKHIAAHLFRHTLASRMLQQGAQLRDIAEVLRHRAYSSTEIYAKIDLRSLDEVVRPWPGQGGGK